MARVEVYRMRAPPYVTTCPECRKAPAILWVVAEAGPILSGSRFEACEACAPDLGQTIIHTVALASAGAAAFNSHGE